ncbi:MFS transporter [Rothia uropygialis]|uniref:MFS transporter n=1 Tax=Kocuria sp. 36 TaxID=1415402 RepID=UPI00101B5E60|nr:MFS transporter [Kocuria sp. 36]
MSTTASEARAERLGTRDKQREARRVIASSFIGSTIEFYDFLLYATATALVFPHVFFTNLDPLAGAIASAGTFAAGYIARPLGGAVFGHFGDRLGRKRMLVLSMLSMGSASTLIGLVPGQASIGSWGAIILIVLRVLQGIAIGGEWGGAALMALEHAKGGKRGFAASFTNAGAPMGAALGTTVMGLANHWTGDAFLEWGWRIPFLLSVVLLAVGIFIRSKVSESPIFKEAVEEEEKLGDKPKLPIWQILRRPKNLILVMLGGAGGFALQAVISIFAIGYAVDNGADRSLVLYLFALASVISIPCVVGWARLSDVVGRKPIMIAGTVIYLVLIFPMFDWYASGNPGLIFLAMVVGLCSHAAIYGPLAAFVSEQFGTSARYTGASMGYQLATLIGAGFTPTIITSIFAKSQGEIAPVLWYLIALGGVSGLFILLTRESKNNDLEAYEH